MSEAEALVAAWVLLALIVALIATGALRRR